MPGFGPSAVIQPDFHLENLVLGEPVVAATNLIIAAAAFYGWRRLRQIRGWKTGKHSMELFFLLLSLATAFGGIAGHALQHYIHYAWKIPGWILSITAAAFLTQSSIFRHGHGKALQWLNWGLLGICMVSAVALLQFGLNLLYNAVSLLLIMLPLEWMAFRRGEAASKWFIGGIGLFLLAAVALVARLTLSVWFTNADLGHLLVASGVLVLSKAADQAFR